MGLLQQPKLVISCHKIDSIHNIDSIETLTYAEHTKATWRQTNLEVCDEIFKVVQLHEIFLTLSKDSQCSSQEDVGTVLCQHDVNHATGEGGWEGATEDSQEPL